MLAYVSEQGDVLTNSCGVVNLDADVDQSHLKKAINFGASTYLLTISLSSI